MEIVLDKLQNPLRKLRKSLKRLSDNPSVEGVHTLRTRARKVEAVSTALMKDHRGKTRKLLQAVKPVRKAAGQVRDMDVLIGNALSLSSKQKNDSLVRLVEHLGEMRTNGAHKLLSVLASQRKNTSRNLKQFAKLTIKWIQKDEVNSENATAAASSLSEELSHWPRFTRDNIHPFRIKVKQLRYLLQFSVNPDREFLEALDRVKDTVGDWHDWYELHEIAATVLDARANRDLLMQIEETGKQKLSLALERANDLRTKYLVPPAKGRDSKRSAPPTAHIVSSNGSATAAQPVT